MLNGVPIDRGKVALMISQIALADQWTTQACSG